MRSPGRARTDPDQGDRATPLYDTGAAWAFKAEALYRVQKDRSISGQWFDLRGISLPRE